MKEASVSTKRIIRIRMAVSFARMDDPSALLFVIRADQRSEGVVGHRSLRTRGKGSTSGRYVSVIDGRAIDGRAGHGGVRII